MGKEVSRDISSRRAQDSRGLQPLSLPPSKLFSPYLLLFPLLQIFLESELFFKGIRPAVNVGLSVSRVGSAAQTKVYKKVAGSLKLYLAQYRELAAFAQFGSDLDASTRYLLNRGARLTELLKQSQFQPLSTEIQIPIIYAGVNGLLDEVPVDKIVDWEAQFRDDLANNQETLLADIAKGEMTDAIESKSEYKRWDGRRRDRWLMLNLD